METLSKWSSKNRKIYLSDYKRRWQDVLLEWERDERIPLERRMHARRLILLKAWERARGNYRSTR
jgi:hypothetical protein